MGQSQKALPHMVLCNKKLFLFLLVLVTVPLLYLTTTSCKPKDRVIYVSRSLKHNRSIACFRYKQNTLPDISTVEVKKGKSIFFHETSCSSYMNDKIIINSRQACAVESAALMNPNFDVYLTFTSPGVFKFENTESDRFLKALMSYDNVRINHLNYENYMKGTIVEELYSKGIIENSPYALEHASDILRFLTLWKYGGIYLDLDVIVLKSFETLPPNFTGCETFFNLGAGILGFGPSDEDGGHIMAAEILEDLKDNFNGSSWGFSGPGVVTRLALKHCKTNETKILCGRICDDYNIYKIEKFYPLAWSSWEKYFNEKDTKLTLKQTKDSHIIHMFNKLSYSRKIPLNSISAYTTFAKKYCPKVFQQCDTNF
ncbi:hypothetical protein WA026_001446 [Henosepilachna vigintioctopunctata]|uniref:Alpha 1,4-glycosyltransferase domain-containing protein n=1 Tax=Henosepilachna vigintioctopunctata TaxID=420089 RepID=A0AAW1UQD5_9CUCU